MPLDITIVGIGKKNSPYEEEIGRYLDLLRPYARMELVQIKPPGKAGPQNGGNLVEEGKMLLSKWPPASYRVALSEEGKSMTSVRFSQWLSGRMQSGKRTVFTIGGAFGLSETIKRQCNEVISLSPMTLPHRLCLVVLVEQIYRACTILSGHPYHK